MSTLLRRGIIAAIGDDIFTLSFKLGGARKVLSLNPYLPKDKISKAVKEFIFEIKKDDVLVLFVQDKYRPYVEEFMKDFAGLPITIYVPDMRSKDAFNVKEFYSSILRKYLGISIELR